MNYCTHCGAPLPEHGKFCSNCGALAEADSSVTRPGSAVGPVYPTQMPAANVPQKPDKKQAGSKGGTICALASLLLSMIGWFSDPPALSVTLAAAALVTGVLVFLKKGRLKVFAVLGMAMAVLIVALCLLAPSLTGGTAAPAAGTAQTQKPQTDSAPRFTPPPALPVPGTSAAPAAGSSAGLDPEMVAFLDSYEAFVDEYVEFMERYSANATNMVTMMNDYLAMLEKLEDFTAQAERYDAGTMSNADAAYYLEVMSRCEIKLLNVLG